VTLTDVLQVTQLCRGTIENEHISFRGMDGFGFGMELVNEQKEETASSYGWTA
jgi:hypothetical protein